jgi:hypothetical protein
MGSAPVLWIGYVANLKSILNISWEYGKDKKGNPDKEKIVLKFSETYKKPEGQLRSSPDGCFGGEMKSAAEVIEEEVAKMILHDRRVIKNKDGKWEISMKGRNVGLDSINPAG